MVNPREAYLAITYRCNLKCKMCNIWQRKDLEEISPEEYYKLPSNLNVVNISGGEPFLRENIDKIIEILIKKNPRLRIVISSNGFYTDAIRTKMIKILKICPNIEIGISLQGLNVIHDKVRGVKGSFENAINSMKMLKDLGIKRLRFSMTFTPENVHQIKDVYTLSKQFGIEFTGTYAQNSDVYFMKKDNTIPNIHDAIPSLDYIIRSELASSKPKKWFRAYYMNCIRDFANGIPGQFICHAGRRFFFMDPMGNIFPCIGLNEPIGNITKYNNFNTLFNSDKAIKVRETADKCQKTCWMVCNARSTIIRHPIKPILWVTKNKLSVRPNK